MKEFLCETQELAIGYGKTPLASGIALRANPGQIDLLQKGFVSFYAGKESSLAENECFRPLSDLQLQWEFFIYGKRSHRITSLQRELIQQILSAVSPH